MCIRDRFKDISTIRVREPEPPTTQSERHTELPAATRINAFFRTASYQLNPVSYTHLDVYKRQAQAMGYTQPRKGEGTWHL